MGALVALSGFWQTAMLLHELFGSQKVSFRLIGQRQMIATAHVISQNSKCTSIYLLNGNRKSYRLSTCSSIGCEHKENSKKKVGKETNCHLTRSGWFARIVNKMRTICFIFMKWVKCVFNGVPHRLHKWYSLSNLQCGLQ